MNMELPLPEIKKGMILRVPSATNNLLPLFDCEIIDVALNVKPLISYELVAFGRVDELRDIDDEEAAYISSGWRLGDFLDDFDYFF